MKISINNRGDKISLVSDVLCNTVLGDLHDKKNQIILLDNVTDHIMQLKKNAATKIRSTRSRKFRIAYKDARDRALGATILYFKTNNIKTDFGYLYFVSSPTYDGYIKIGKSEDAESRLLQYQTSTPFRDFELKKYIVTHNRHELERLCLSYFRTSGALIDGTEWAKTDDFGNEFKKICQMLKSVGYDNRFVK